MTSLTDKYINPFTDFGFKKLFGEEAELAQMPAEMRQSYEDSLKYYRDLNSVIDTAFDDGVKVGREEGVHLTAKNMLSLGLDIDMIAKCTGLSIQQIDALK